MTHQEYIEALKDEWNGRAPDFLEACGGQASKETIIESCMEFVLWEYPQSEGIDSATRRKLAEEVFTEDY